MERMDYDRDGILEIRLSAHQLKILDSGNGIEIVQPTGDTILIRPGGLTDAERELVEEFEENALGEVAEHLREHGTADTRAWIDGKIAEVRAGDDPMDPEGGSLGNLEVARDRLTV